MKYPFLGRKLIRNVNETFSKEIVLFFAIYKQKMSFIGMLNNILNEKRPHDFGTKLEYSCLGDTRSLIMFQCIIIKEILRLGHGHNLKSVPRDLSQPNLVS